MNIIHKIEEAKSLIRLKSFKYKVGMPLLYSKTCEVFCSNEPPYVLGESAGLVFYLRECSHGDVIRTTSGECASLKSELLVPDIEKPSMIGFMLQLLSEFYGCELDDINCFRDPANNWCVCWKHPEFTEVKTLVPSEERCLSRVDALIKALKNTKRSQT